MRTPIETEAKCRLLDPQECRARLAALGLHAREPMLQRDEYFDTEGRRLGANDFVVRLRTVGSDTEVALKGPRLVDETGNYSRVELEFPGGSSEKVRERLRDKGLLRVWILEKEREEWCPRIGKTITVAIDRLPHLGYFVELEGAVAEIAKLRSVLGETIGESEPRNYTELYLDSLHATGADPSSVQGLTFG